MGILSRGKLATNDQQDKSVNLIGEFSQTSSIINSYEAKVKQNSSTIIIRTE
jgi:hypothetical protein